MGQKDFPAFWSRSSGLPSPLSAERASEAAQAHVMRGEMGLAGGQLVANPIPVEAEIAAEELAPVIAEALAAAEAEGIAAKAVTPFLLDRIFKATEGRSLTANIALVRNNARLAAELAGEIAKIRSQMAR